MKQSEIGHFGACSVPVSLNRWNIFPKGTTPALTRRRSILQPQSPTPSIATSARPPRPASNQGPSYFASRSSQLTICGNEVSAVTASIASDDSRSTKSLRIPVNNGVDRETDADRNASIMCFGGEYGNSAACLAAMPFLTVSRCTRRSDNRARSRFNSGVTAAKANFARSFRRWSSRLCIECEDCNATTTAHTVATAATTWTAKLPHCIKNSQTAGPGMSSITMRIGSTRLSPCFPYLIGSKGGNP